MATSNLIPVITTPGKIAAVTAAGNGLKFAITHIAFGTGSYAVTGLETALQSEVKRITASGGNSTSPNEVVLNGSVQMPTGQGFDATEIGFFGVGMDGVTRLFAVYSLPSNQFKLPIPDSYALVLTYTLGLVGLPASSVTVTVDPSGAAASVVITDHVAQTDPHPQYLNVTEGNALIAAHVTQADPHTVYLNTTRGNTLVNTAITAHMAAANPHTQYLQQTIPLTSINFTGAGTRLTYKNAGGILDQNLIVQNTGAASGAGADTYVLALPNAGSQQAGFFAYNSSDPFNAAYVSAFVNATEAIMGGGKNGGGAALPLGIFNNGIRSISVTTGGETIFGPNFASNPIISNVNGWAYVPAAGMLANHAGGPALTLGSSGGGARTLEFQDSGTGTVAGWFQNNTTAVSFVNVSDRRRKDDVTAMADDDVIDRVQPVRFKWKSNGQADFGFIAQDVHAVFPDAVSVGDDAEGGEVANPWAVNVSAFIPKLVARAKAQAQRIEELEDMLIALSERIDALEKGGA